MNTMQQPRRRSHLGTWFVILLGALEIGALVAFFKLDGAAKTMCAYAGMVPSVAAAAPLTPSGAAAAAPAGGAAVPAGGAAVPAGGAAMPPGGAAMPPGGGAGAAATADAATTLAPASPAAGAAGTTTGGDASAGGDAHASGDTDQIVDPNCVGKTAASLLSSGTAPPAGPTCGPMKQPEALKAAEKQVSP